MSITTVAIVGYGARGVLTKIHMTCQEIIAKFNDPNFTIVPRDIDSYDALSVNEGFGNAFNSPAALNTGLGRPHQYDMANVPEDIARQVSHLLDLAGRYEAKLMKDPAATQQRLDKENICTSLSFSTTSHCGKLNTQIACGPRDVVGDCLRDMDSDASIFAKRYTPWLKFTHHTNARVTDIDLDNPVRPVLTIIINNRKVIRAYDFVHKVTGTTWTLPVHGDTARHAYTNVPHLQRITEYLSHRALLDHHERLVPGSVIAIGGASLSAGDWVGPLLRHTNLVRRDPAKPGAFIIDDGEVLKYQGLLHFFNRTDGEFMPSRHSLTPFLAKEDELLCPEEILGLSLDQKTDPFGPFVEAARIITAQHFDKHPSEIEPKMTTTNLLQRMFHEDEQHSNGQETETAVFRAALLSLLFRGAIGGRDHQGPARIREMYPDLVRGAFSHCQGLTYNASHTRDIDVEGSSHADAVRTAMCHITAQPSEIHHLVTTLYHRGVITYGQASYKQVAWLDAEDFFDVNGHRAQALFASRILTTASDHLASRINAAARAGGHLPIYRKGRIVMHHSGRYIHVAEHGLPGHGTRDGRLVRSMQWMDTNNYEAAAYAAPMAARFLRNVTALIDSGKEDPIALVHAIADSVNVKPILFEEQTSRLRPHYINGRQILCAAKLLGNIYADPVIFKSKLSRCRTEAGRLSVRDEVETLGESVARHLREYDAELASIVYTPHTVESFDRTTPDYNEVQGLAIERRIYQLLKTRHSPVPVAIANQPGQLSKAWRRALARFMSAFLPSRSVAATTYGLAKSDTSISHRVVIVTRELG